MTDHKIDFSIFFYACEHADSRSSSLWSCKLHKDARLILYKTSNEPQIMSDKAKYKTEIICQNFE